MSTKRIVENMDPALIDSVILIAVGIIAAITIHDVLILLKKRAELTETKLDNLILHSLSTPLVMLAFFIPFSLAIRQVIALYPQYGLLSDSKMLDSGYIVVGTWIVATFIAACSAFSTITMASAPAGRTLHSPFYFTVMGRWNTRDCL